MKLAATAAAWACVELRPVVAARTPIALMNNLRVCDMRCSFLGLLPTSLDAQPDDVDRCAQRDVSDQPLLGVLLALHTGQLALVA